MMTRTPKKTAISKPAEPSFKVGDVVTLRSGGMKMTVTSIWKNCASENVADVMFSEREGRHWKMRSITFPAAVLGLACNIDDDIPF